MILRRQSGVAGKKRLAAEPEQIRMVIIPAVHVRHVPLRVAGNRASGEVRRHEAAEIGPELPGLFEDAVGVRDVAGIGGVACRVELLPLAAVQGETVDAVSLRELDFAPVEVRRGRETGHVVGEDVPLLRGRRDGGSGQEAEPGDLCDPVHGHSRLSSLMTRLRITSRSESKPGEQSQKKKISSPF